MFKILHIDDEELIREFLLDFVSNLYEEIQLVSLESWAEAKPLLQAGEKFSLILLDEIMPDTSGSVIYKEICKDYPSMKDQVVFLTGSKNVGMTDRPYLEKPFELKALHQLITDFKNKKIIS